MKTLKFILSLCICCLLFQQATAQNFVKDWDMTFGTSQTIGSNIEYFVSLLKKSPDRYYLIGNAGLDDGDAFPDPNRSGNRYWLIEVTDGGG